MIKDYKGPAHIPAEATRREVLLITLRDLLEASGEFEIYIGICNAVARFTNSHYRSLRPFFPTWKHFSGDSLYPIPATEAGRSPHTQYLCATSRWQGNQLMYRRSLLRHLLREVEVSTDEWWDVRYD